MCGKEIVRYRRRRRPVRKGLYLTGADLQGEMPMGWCEVCGKEVYAQQKGLCEECERWGMYEEKSGDAAGAVPRLYTGGGQIQLRE